MELHRIVRGVAEAVGGGVPDDVARHAALVLADTVGAAIAGGRATELAALAAGSDPRPQAELAAGVPAATTKAPAATAAAEAAALNAMAAVWLEIDEDSKPGGHVAAQVLPAVLAVAQRDGVAGDGVLAGLVAGYEVAAALYSMVELRYPVHPHGLFGAVGAAVGCAVASGLDPFEPAAIAAGLLPIGVWDPCTEGATVRHVLAGDAARVGVRACDLAAAGFVPSRTAMGSLTAALGCRVRRPQPENAGLGWEYAQITQNTFKRHSACLHAHAAIDATLEIRGQALADPADITDVMVAVTSRAVERIGGPPRPNSLSTRFSVPYAVAAALLHGDAGLRSMDFDERVLNLARAVRVVVDDGHARRDEPIGGATVTVRTAHGEHSARVDRPRGVCDNPLSPAELRAKFCDVVGTADADAHYERLLALFSAPQVTALYRT